MITLFIFLFFRVVETLRNSVDFAKAFNCKLGSPMNPEQKCEVWWQLLNQFRNIFLEYECVGIRVLHEM